MYKSFLFLPSVILLNPTLLNYVMYTPSSDLLKYV